MLRRSFSESLKKIGFIGVGLMGSPMAAHLLRHNYQVCAYDINPAPVDHLVALGARKAVSYQDAALGADTVILSLPGSEEVEEAVTGAHGISTVMRPGTLLIDSSTTSPFLSRKLAAILEPRGVSFLDAPTSGGTIGAKLGTLTIMVGGEEAVYQRTLPLLKTMGKNIIYCGKHGAGLVIKMCNNLGLASINIAICEALNLGVKMGVDGKTLYDVLSVSTARSWPLDTSNPIPGVLPAAPSSRNYEGGFPTVLLSKELSITLDIAKQCGAQAILGERAGEFYKQLVDAGAGRKDFGIVYQAISHNKLK